MVKTSDMNFDNDDSSSRRDGVADRLMARYRIKISTGILAPADVLQAIQNQRIEAYNLESQTYEQELLQEKADQEAKEMLLNGAYSRDTVNALKNAASNRMIEIFPLIETERCKEQMATLSSDNRPRVKATLRIVQVNDGRREIPSFKNIGKKLDEMNRLFGNFEDVLDDYADELMFAGAANPESMRIAPRLLNGPPGVGKTAFCQAFAKSLGLPFVKLSGGGMQHSSVLCGTASHWANSQPGEVFNLLANNSSGSGSGVLLIDEVDKISNRLDTSIMPALLDLLEPETSKNYRDESLGLTFDASHLIVVMTSNSTESIDAALLSRCRTISVEMPSPEQKMALAVNVHEGINGALPKAKRTKLDMDAMKSLVESDLDIRELIMAIQKGCSRALRDKNRVAVPVHKGVVEKKRSIGFI